MPTTLEAPHAAAPVHQPTPYEIWRSTQPYVGRHRRPATVETAVQADRATARE